MPMMRTDFQSLLAEGLRKVFFLWLKNKPQMYRDFYQVLNSKKQKETDQTIAGLGMISEKLEGEPITYDDLVEGYGNNALVKPPVINGESLSSVSMATLSKQAQAVQEQRLSLVAA